MINIQTLDLNFLGIPGLIASYLIEHDSGVVLIESGPGSTSAALKAGLEKYGFSPGDVTDLFLTHIHLDHAGAAGWLASHGAHVHVHDRGYAHLADPSKLIASASRIYGDQMDRLWGEMLPVPETGLTVLSDGAVVDFGAFTIRAVDTPGHANHHMSFLVDDILFSGDVGGIRLDGPRYLLMPMPPPEFHLEKWQNSWQKLSELGAKRIAPTHFGVFNDAKEHLELLGSTLADTDEWLSTKMPDIEFDALGDRLTAWMKRRAERYGLNENEYQRYETANASKTSAGGVWRYWSKYRKDEV